MRSIAFQLLTWIFTHPTWHTSTRNTNLGVNLQLGLQQLQRINDRVHQQGSDSPIECKFAHIQRTPIFTLIGKHCVSLNMRQASQSSCYRCAGEWRSRTSWGTSTTAQDSYPLCFAVTGYHFIQRTWCIQGAYKQCSSRCFPNSIHGSTTAKAGSSREAPTRSCLHQCISTCTLTPTIESQFTPHSHVWGCCNYISGCQLISTEQRATQPNLTAAGSMFLKITAGFGLQAG